jgi:hypothetical protein
MSAKLRLPLSLRLSEVVTLLGITRQSVAAHVRTGVIEKTGRDSYTLASITRYISGLRKTAASGGLSAERAHLTKIRARRAEIELGILQGQYLPAGDFERALVALVTRSKMRLLSVPAKAAVRIGLCKGVVEIQGLLKREIEGALMELSDYSWKPTDIGGGDGQP